MATLSELADNFATNERPAGNLLDVPSVLAQALAATGSTLGMPSFARMLAFRQRLKSPATPKSAIPSGR